MELTELQLSLAEVAGDRVNRGAGYGLEGPCIHRLFGPKPYLDKAQEAVTSIYKKGLL